MTVNELFLITPRSLFNKLQGHQRKHRDQWEQTRYICYFSVAPWMGEGQSPSISEFMPFAWDGEATEDKFAILRAEAEKARKMSQHQWDSIDKSASS